MDKKTLKKIWYFIWESDSIWSWIVNIILAFLLIYFVVYPVLGFAFQTTHPVVAVVSESMEHRTTPFCVENNEGKCLNYDYKICGTSSQEKQRLNLDEYWDTCGNWYETNTDITKEDFSQFRFKNGFNKGDIMVLKGDSPEEIKQGDVIVYYGRLPDPIIHRVVKTTTSFQTKGDHNANADSQEILKENTVGFNKYQKTSKAVLRVPYLGWIKIWFVEKPMLFILVIIAFILLTSYHEEILKYFRG